MSTVAATPPAETERVSREDRPIPSQPGEPAWEIARLFPLQGEWTEDEYLALNTTRLIEFDEGVLEFLPMPDPWHAYLVRFLVDRLREFVEPRRLGDVLWAPLRVMLWPGKIREPDIVFVRPERVVGMRRPLAGADLVIEIVSPGEPHRSRDLVVKRNEYARAGIPEYWIVDPETQTITVLALVGAEYQVHGEFKPGQAATSALLTGFVIDVTACFNAGRDALEET